MKTLNINGDIISSDLAWIYRWYGFDYTCPGDVRAVIDSLESGEELVVTINSGGGDVMAGQEIYSILSKIRDRVTIEIQSMAASAASMIAMAGKTVKISPVAMMMIHNAACQTSGDYHAMEHTAGVLKTVNSSIAQAYIEKTGMSEEELLALMDKETWLSANDCVRYGFCDEIIKDDATVITNAVIGNLSVTDEMIQKAKSEKAEADALLADLDNYGV